MKRAKAAGWGVALLTGWAASATSVQGQPAPAMLPAELRAPDKLPAAFSAPQFMSHAPARALPPTFTDPVWSTSKPRTASAPPPAHAELPRDFVPASSVDKPMPLKVLPVIPVISPMAVPASPSPPPIPSSPAGPFEVLDTSVDAPPAPMAVPMVMPAAPAAPTVTAPPPVAPPAPVAPPVPMAVPKPAEVPPPPPPPAAAPAPKPVLDVPPPFDDTLRPPKPSARPMPEELQAPKTVPPAAPVGQAPDVWGATGTPRPEMAELQPAPPEVVFGPTPGVPFHKGTFGSPPIRLSRDFPPLSDIIQHSHSALADDTAAAGSAPATDRAFVQLEYLLWWTNRDRVPTLATTSINGGDGYLGQSGTVPLIGPGAIGPSARNGFRVRAGAWLSDCGTCGIDGSFFFLGQRTDTTTLTSDLYPIITRPFFAANNGGFEFGEVVAAPGISTGTLTVENDSFLWGADVNARKALCRQCDRQIEVFAGFRFLALDESLRITENLVALPGRAEPAGTVIEVQDSFQTRNRFYGGQIGGVYNQRWGRFDLYTRGSIALGATTQQVEINGYQIVNPPGGAPSQSYVGGLLATTTNIGTFDRTAFSAVPEVTLNLGYWLTPNFKAYVGYNLLYWPNVVRPGGEVDRVVNVSNVPNPPMNVPPSNVNRPVPTFRESDLAIQGVQLGMEFRW